MGKMRFFTIITIFMSLFSMEKQQSKLLQRAFSGLKTLLASKMDDSAALESVPSNSEATSLNDDEKMQLRIGTILHQLGIDSEDHYTNALNAILDHNRVAFLASVNMIKNEPLKQELFRYYNNICIVRPHLPPPLVHISVHDRVYVPPLDFSGIRCAIQEKCAALSAARDILQEINDSKKPNSIRVPKLDLSFAYQKIIS